MEFDETNGSQGEVFACDDVGDEPLREVMKNIAIGQVKPREEDEENISPSTKDGAPSKDDSKEEASPTIHHDESSDEEDEAPQPPPQDVQDEQVVQEQLHFDDIHISSEQAQAQAQNVEPQEDSTSQP